MPMDGQGLLDHQDQEAIMDFLVDKEQLDFKEHLESVDEMVSLEFKGRRDDQVQFLYRMQHIASVSIV